CQQHESYPLTF
nr:immunoglobulin light chain junction region [Macaca mulatta]MOV78351.1 immunoglobulin light chain junction region [Macaca mulatta]MOV81813.1 immunoglobulin light chain junction region [Macaca mulatta]MOV83862.1 immunoglobulin light chain junction region [Macaca mulatta]